MADRSQQCTRSLSFMISTTEPPSPCRNRAPKTDRVNQVPSWEFRNRRKPFTPRQLARILWDFAYLCWANPNLGLIRQRCGEPHIWNALALWWLTMFVMIPTSAFILRMNTLMRHFAHMKKHEPTSPSYRCEIQEGRVISTEMCLRNGV